MSAAAEDHEIFKALRSERRWAIADKAAMWFCAFATAVLCVGLVSAAVLVTETAWSAPDRGVMDGDQ